MAESSAYEVLLAEAIEKTFRIEYPDLRCDGISVEFSTDISDVAVSEKLIRIHPSFITPDSDIIEVLTQITRMYHLLLTAAERRREQAIEETYKSVLSHISYLKRVKALDILRAISEAANVAVSEVSVRR